MNYVYLWQFVCHHSDVRRLYDKMEYYFCCIPYSFSPRKEPSPDVIRSHLGKNKSTLGEYLPENWDLEKRLRFSNVSLDHSVPFGSNLRIRVLAPVSARECTASTDYTSIVVLTSIEDLINIIALL